MQDCPSLLYNAVDKNSIHSLKGIPLLRQHHSQAAQKTITLEISPLITGLSRPGPFTMQSPLLIELCITKIVIQTQQRPNNDTDKSSEPLNSRQQLPGQLSSCSRQRNANSPRSSLWGPSCKSRPRPFRPGSFPVHRGCCSLFLCWGGDDGWDRRLARTG